MPRLARRTWSGRTSLGPVLLLLALLPMFSYLGHWSMFLEEALGSHVEDADAAEHANHCHLGVANCADQPILESVRLIPAVVDLPEPGLSLTPVEGASTSMSEHILSVPTEPPRAA